jgi:CheY-like chemotaxis protein
MTKIDSVLLIDDDHINNYMNEKLIRKLKISDIVHVATNGSEAIQFVEDQDMPVPPLIFLDLSMPAIDGFEFLEIYQKMDIPEKDKVLIVILTTSSNFSDMERIKQIGNYEFLTKPLNEEKLLRIIEKYFAPFSVTSDTQL